MPIRLFDFPIYGLEQQQKQRVLLDELSALSKHHYRHCPEYKLLLDAQGYSQEPTNYSELFPLAVRLFKHTKLSSVQESEVFKVMTSSGTTSQVVSQVVLDRDTASLQSKALVQIMKEWIGKQRLPMLIIDHRGLSANKAGYSARGAGVQGLSFMGRDHCFALDERMNLRWREVSEFAEKYRDQPVLIFGFTFMVWQYLLAPLEAAGKSLALKQGFLFHSGGWKKLQDKAVDNPTFKATVHSAVGNVKVHNFYGMVEQTGSIFVECEHGHLHSPVFADLIVRSKSDLKPCQVGQEGVIQVLSNLAKSYPGHSLLTEDLGRILGEDNCPCGRKGRYFEVLGRLPKVEVRGCSDTFQ
ncbi:acyl-protein synthetase [Aliagarivorans marinus]|uniref:LuxE/PaaK family acyltransferase n=1 Tax=Aliagarivorans marinus TaxID=561965 RepID=UPI0004174088|nr:acyl-protein synthetase [Aliagarivorans marinus]